MCYAISFNIRRDEYWHKFLESVVIKLISEMQSQSQIIFFYFIHKYCPNRYIILKTKVGFSIKKELYEYVDYHNQKESFDKAKNNNVCILSESSINQIIELIKNREVAFLMSKIFRFEERDSNGVLVKKNETRYSVVKITRNFKETIIETLNELKYKIMDEKQLEIIILESINKPIKDLIPSKPVYFRFADLPQNIRSPKSEDWQKLKQSIEHVPEAANDWLDITQSQFQNQIQILLEKNIHHKYADVQDVNDIVNELKYEPVKLIRHFQ